MARPSRAFSGTPRGEIAIHAPEIVADFETDDNELTREEVEAARALLRHDPRQPGGAGALAWFKVAGRRGHSGRCS